MSEATFNAATASLELGTTRIEASAGTGKTYTLAALYLRLIAEAGLDIGSILVTTFTIPATAELRDRIRARLHGAVAMFEVGPGNDALLTQLHPIYLPRKDEIQPRLERALRQFDNAAISTIHGFCQRLLQERAFETGVTFDTELLTDQSPLLREIADDFWRSKIYPAQARFGAFALLGKLEAAALAKLLGNVIARPTMQILPPHRDGDLARTEADLLAAFAEVEKTWKEGRDELRSLFDQAAVWAKGDMKKPEVTNRHLDGLARCFSDAASPRADYEALDFFTQQNLIDCTAARSRMNPSHPIFAACDRLAEAREYWLLTLRREFLAWAPGALATRKTQRNVLSFDDLLLRLQDVLRGNGSALIAATRQRYAAALVDEFQDTDPVQAEIFERLFSGHGRLYFIGDPKQAIYGFRGADVFSYLRAAERAEHRHELRANQRSVTPLVAAVNAIFKEGSRAFVVEGIEFHASNAAGRRDAEALGQEPPFQFWLWSDGNPVTAKAANERLPKVVADQIIRQLSDGARSGERSLVPSDFAVLTTNNAEARAVHAALTSAGLPAVVMSDSSVFRSDAATDMLALLHALSRPAHEESLRAALATTILRHEAAMLAALADDESAWTQVLERFAEHYEQWLAGGFFPMFRRFLVEWEVRPHLLARPDGERWLTNLLHLAELLHAAASADRLGPAALAQWLARQMHRDASTSEEHEQRLESDDAAVKVVTVHKSKGLEFNVVWVPFSWCKADLRRDESITFHHRETGELMLDLGSSQIDAHRAEAERERLAEQVRLLYVALTRARLQCHFVAGHFSKCDNSAAAWVLHPPGGKEADALAALRSRKIDDATVRDDIRALAEAEPGAFAIQDVPEPQRLRFTRPSSPHPHRAPRVFSATIPRDWNIASFSSLTAFESVERPDYDRDATTAALPELAQADIHAFPRGVRAGNCLHEIFERLDFRDDDAIQPLVARKLGVFGFDTARFGSVVGECVRRVLSLELAPDLRLADVPNCARLDEVEFCLPAGPITAKRLGHLLGEELSFSEFRGFLRGFMDLVFEKDGRFYLVDWKSNWLGPATADYTPEAIAAEMRRHHYRVQYHLYVIALHRLLARRVRGYDYARHFGGVFYLFLRGIDPERPGLGIFRDKPSAKTIAALDALFTRER